MTALSNEFGKHGQHHYWGFIKYSSVSKAPRILIIKRFD